MTGDRDGDRPARLLAAAPAEVRIQPVGSVIPPTAARSYAGDGRMALWTPQAVLAGRYAVDAEIAARPVPPALAARFGVRDAAVFWPRWTAVEVGCKLRGVPILVWLREYGLARDPAVAVRTFSAADLVISCAVLPAPTVTPGWSAVASVPSPC